MLITLRHDAIHAYMLLDWRVIFALLLFLRRGISAPDADAAAVFRCHADAAAIDMLATPDTPPFSLPLFCRRYALFF